MIFELMIRKLQEFWEKQGCTIAQPYDMEKGAATLSPNTFFKALGPEHCSVAYLEPCRRPIDSRYAKDKTLRYQWYFQFQVLIKPALDDPKKIFLHSLELLGITEEKHEILFIEDNWISPVFGANAEGWEVWVDGVEIAQISYLIQVGGIDCNPVSLEFAYGLERLALKTQGVNSFHQLKWNDTTTYGDLFKLQEIEHSKYNCETSSPEILKQLFSLYIEEARLQLTKGLVFPCFDYLLKSSHTYNLIESRGILPKKKLDLYVCKIRELAKQVGVLYIEKYITNK